MPLKRQRIIIDFKGLFSEQRVLNNVDTFTLTRETLSITYYHLYNHSTLTFKRSSIRHLSIEIYQ